MSGPRQGANDPARVTAELLGKLHRISQYDPDYLPREVELMEALAHQA